jgi:zinc transporter ZupT
MLWSVAITHKSTSCVRSHCLGIHNISLIKDSGAVKSNIGHLEGTSGLAGIVKTILALEHGIIPPNATYEQVNPAIDHEFFNLKVRIICSLLLICGMVGVER